MDPKKQWAEQRSRRPELGPTDRDRPEKKTRRLSNRRRGSFGKVVWPKDEHGCPDHQGLLRLEEAGGFKITPEFERSHRAALKAQLEGIEKEEKLKDVQTRLTCVENSPTILAKETTPVDELLTTLLEAIRCRNEPVGKEPVGPAQVENDKNLDSLLQPYHPHQFHRYVEVHEKNRGGPAP
ncbi:hypothetical protein E3N88_12107 [Mikania micrantha]|uniref:Uncharacterized protein n=1 Tax=Mikania micrantha TaxID=192012 RepID=A0A5N6P5X0_9ASTR|nr:hypothetical protein E3N88_12107 [Mikania micrantha]